MSTDIDGLLPLPELTTPEDGFDLLKESVVEGAIGKKNKLEGKNQFNGIVLTKVSDLPFTAIQVSAMFGITISNNDNSKYFGYRVKITDEDSPHSFYPNPCSIEKEGTLTPVNSVICSMHTMIIVPDSQPLNTNDTCIVRLNKIGGKYDLSYGHFVSRTGHDDEYTDRILAENPYLRQECGKTGALFNASVGSNGLYPKISWNLKTQSNAREFFNKLKNSPFFAGFSDGFLWGLTANASAESGFVSNIGGDPESLIGKRTYSPIKKFCSFGYWQLNLCSGDGEGTRLMQSYGQELTRDLYDPATEEKYFNFITSENQQFLYVSGRMKELFPSSWNNSSITAEEAARLITVEFEKPVNKEQKGIARGSLAKKFKEEYEKA
jgi:hypothetical protein